MREATRGVTNPPMNNEGRDMTALSIRNRIAIAAIITGSTLAAHT